MSKQEGSVLLDCSTLERSARSSGLLSVQSHPYALRRNDPYCLDPIIDLRGLFSHLLLPECQLV